MILLFTNEHYKKINKGTKEKRKAIKKQQQQQQKKNQNKREIKLITPIFPPFLIRIEY